MARFTQYLAYSLSLSVVFSICKIIYMWMIKSPLASWISLFPNISADIIAGFLVCLVVLIKRPAGLFIIYLGIIFYCFSWFYAVLFDGFLHYEALGFGKNALQFKDSFISMIHWWMLPILVLLLLLFHYLSKLITVLLSENSPTRQIVSVLLVVTLATSTYSNRSLALHGDINSNPIVKLLVGAIHRSLMKEADEDVGKEVTHQRTWFDVTTLYPMARNGLVNKKKINLSDKQTPRNVVIVQMESTGNVSRRRGSDVVMPNFELLAKNGLFFPNAYATVILSIKSIFALHLGFYPSADFSLITNTRPNIPMKALPSYFKEANYRTALFHGGKFSFYNKLSFLENRGYDLLYDSTSLPNRGDYEKHSWGIDDAAVFEYAKEWIEQSEESFFLYLIPILPHHPYKTPSAWKKQFPENRSIDRYHNSLYYEDELLGRLIDYLKERGIFQDTLLVVVGDHGEAFQQHKGNYLHSIRLFEENVNVPLLFSNELLFPNAVVNRKIASLVDVMPTILDITRVGHEGYEGDGQSLLSTSDNRMAFFGTFYKGQTYGLRDQNFKYIYQADVGTSELYDLQQDPEETNNIADKHIELVGRYKSKVTEWAEYTKSTVKNYKPRYSSTDIVRMTDLPILFHAQDYGKLKYGETINGNPFRVSGEEYKTFGWGTHANSIIEIDVAEFKGYLLDIKLARDEESKGKPKGEIFGEIRLDGKTIYKTGPVHSFERPLHIRIPINGNRLSLLTLKGDDGGTSDHVDWLEPKLLPR